MTIAVEQRSLWDVFIREPVDLIKDQPHQVLLSAGSVAIMAAFASSAKIVDPLVGYCIAGGVEWAYLRGIASDARARSKWGTLLSWSAFFIVVLWGVLWVLKMYSIIPEQPTPLEGVGIGLAHIVPVAWLSLCSAMCHRTMLQAEINAATQHQQTAAARHREMEEQRMQFERAQAEADRKFARDQQEKQLKFEQWERAQRIKAELQVTAHPQPVTAPVAPQPATAQPVTINNVTYPSKSAAAAALGISRAALGKRLKKAQAAEEA
ncbi:MAG TPA: hypothetical protein VFT66_15540 [Roseiflexaceae bacterium]|nr:hypothetical protein [Roseiflexaceae bacterium]